LGDEIELNATTKAQDSIPVFWWIERSKSNKKEEKRNAKLLKAKTDRLNELNALLNVDKRESEIVGGEPDEGEEPPEKKPRDLER